MPSLLILHYSLTGGSRQLAEAALEGASTAAIEARLLDAREAQAEDLLAASGYLFVFPENLAAIAGEMKALFDRAYYPLLGQVEGRAYAIIVCAGSDGGNAVRQAERIATGWRLKRVTDSRIVLTHAQTPEAILAPKTIAEADLAAARETGALLAEGLAMGLF